MPFEHIVCSIYPDDGRIFSTASIIQRYYGIQVFNQHDAEVCLETVVIPTRVWMWAKVMLKEKCTGLGIREI